MRKKPTRKRPYFKMESAMTAILRDASGKMHHGILFDPPLPRKKGLSKVIRRLSTLGTWMLTLAFNILNCVYL